MAVSRPQLVTLAFIVEAILAGGNSVAIRYSNRELPPLFGAGLRIAIAAIIVMGIMLVLRHPVPRGKILLGTMLYGLLQFGGVGSYYLALVQIHAGVGQTLLALVPLATLLLAVVQRQEKLSVSGIIGTLLGLAGIGLIFFNPGRDVIPLPALLLALVSVVCFGQALVVVRILPPIHPVTLNAVGMVIGAMVLLALSLFMGEVWTTPKRTETWIALSYVIVFGSVVTFLLHVFVAQNWSASRASYVMVTIPLVTVFLSARLDQEPVTTGLLMGGLLVLGGVYVGALREVHDPRAAIEIP